MESVLNALYRICENKSALALMQIIIYNIILRADDPEGPHEIGLPRTVAAGGSMATWRGGRERLTRARKQL